MQKILLQLLGILLISPSCWAKDSLDIYSFEIPDYMQADKTGAFVDMVQRISIETNLDIQIKLLPPKRVVEKFNEKKIEAYFPALSEFDRVKSHVSVPFYYKKDHLFYKDPNLLENLNGKRLCLTSGYYYLQEYIKKFNFKVEQVATDEACLKMLIKGRVDAFMCEVITGIASMEKIKLEGILITDRPVASQPVRFSFAYSEKGKKYAFLFSRAIEKMIKNGDMIKIFGKSFDRAKRYKNINYDPFKANLK
jgi:ABC-type amino acid transport substrate-binding protein